MTLPKVNKDLLMFPVYLIISPWDFDYFSLSLPAKSTKLIFPYLLIFWDPCFISLIIYMVIIEWLRLESLFISCDALFLFFMPSSNTDIISSTLLQSTTIRSSTKKPLEGFQRQCKTPDWGFSKSLICSLYIYVKLALTK